jgi:uroporphyrinogen decarboxylase
MNAMTPKQRVVAALRREPVDRLPVVEMAIDWAVMRGLGYRRYADMIRGLDLDAAPVNQALYLMGWRRWVLPFVEYYTDEWGVRSRFAGELLPVPVGHPLPTPAAFNEFRPPKPEKSPILKAIRYVKRRLPDRAIVLVSRNDFAASWFLCGFDVLLMSFIDDPEFVGRLGRMVNDYYARLFELAIEAGVDVVFLTDDYAYKSGTLMSREHFERFVLPLLRRSVGAIHDAGGLCVKHTDGDVSGILDLIVETGVDGIGPLEPAAGNDLAEIQRRWGDRVAVIGNVDVDLLSRGSAAEVQSVTETLVRALAPRGGHLLSSGNTITSSVQAENFRTMITAGRKAYAEETQAQ